MVNEAISFDYDIINTGISELLGALENETDCQLVQRMKKIIPEFEPQNFIYHDTLSQSASNN